MHILYLYAIILMIAIYTFFDVFSQQNKLLCEAICCEHN